MMLNVCLKRAIFTCMIHAAGGVCKINTATHVRWVGSTIYLHKYNFEATQWDYTVTEKQIKGDSNPNDKYVLSERTL